jgi:endonuclease/exonuclease/phosphatase family metal-dependent hydrolase
MKIISWNSKFGFDEAKVRYIHKFSADIYVIQECTKSDVDQSKTFIKNSVWYGDNIDSKYGIGIFSDIFDIELLPEHNSDFRYIVPYRVFSKNKEFVLIVVWTKDKDKNNTKIEYTEQMWNAINFNGYKEILSGPVIIAGDFNSNNYWEKQYSQNKVHSHRDIINKLMEFNIESAYHKYFNCENGNEKEPTLLWKMDKNNKYHIDYCFVSSHFRIKNIQIGSIDEWEKTKYSDHCPLIIELD